MSKELMQILETKYLNLQKRRNKSRFPKDFCFQLTSKEYNNLRLQNVTAKFLSSRRNYPYVFTEEGIYIKEI